MGMEFLGAPPLDSRDPGLREALRARLASFDVQTLAHDDAHQAAVALAILDEGPGADVDGLIRPVGWSPRPAMLLTRRSVRLRRHAGQWALPGGRIDPGESPETAALRELDEEVGLRLSPESVLGRLDDFHTRSGYIITPVVVWAGEAPRLMANADEVESVHRIALQEFLRTDSPMLEHRPEYSHPVLRMPIGASWIAAPTAAMLYQFREWCLLGRATRVSHFEQPDFAWR